MVAVTKSGREASGLMSKLSRSMTVNARFIYNPLFSTDLPLVMYKANTIGDRIAGKKANDVMMMRLFE